MFVVRIGLRPDAGDNGLQVLSVICHLPKDQVSELRIRDASSGQMVRKNPEARSEAKK